MKTVVAVKTVGNFDVFLYRDNYHQYSEINMLSCENHTFEQVENFLNQ